MSEELSPDELSSEPVEIVITAEEAGERLDVVLARRFPLYSRSLLRRAIAGGGVLVNDKRTKLSHRFKGGETVSICLPDLPRQAPRPENIPLQVIHEDETLIVLNKQPGMVVHPARGHWSGTMASALTYHFENLSSVGGPARPGIVHRLDRDTSGVILVARSDVAHSQLAIQFQDRTVEKEYLAITAGTTDRDRDWIEAPIGLHPQHREKMAIRRDDPRSREAASFFEVVERFDGFSLIRILPKTGRTHQIRVHLASIGCPVLCDRQYGGRAQITRGEITRQADDSVVLARQALHAYRIKLMHPATGRPVEFTAPLLDDMQETLNLIRRYRTR